MPKISIQEMLKAKRNKKAAKEILDKIEKFIMHLANKMYYYYGAQNDNSVDIDDIRQLITMYFLYAIKKFKPYQYNKLKDKSGRKSYQNPISYFKTIAKRVVTQHYAQHSRKKRIPLNKIVSLDAPIDEEGNTLGDILHEEEKASKFPFSVSEIKYLFSNQYAAGHSLYKMAKWYFDDSLTFMEIGHKLGRSKQAIKQLFDKYIIPKLKETYKEDK